MKNELAPLASRLRRRSALAWLAAGLGSPLLPTRLALAGSSDDEQAPRLVVVMLRGALDGLAAVPAIGDPAWQALRGEALAATAAADADAARPLDGTLFALHPALRQLHRWWAERELLVFHAIASPYRERSHFDAQQLLESGGERPFALQTGWLGRALQAAGQPGVALSPAMPVALRGAEQASTWTPSRQVERIDADLLSRVARLYANDAPLAEAWSRALAQQGLVEQAGMSGAMAGAIAGAMAGTTAAGANDGFSELARQAGRLLAAPRGARVAWLESSGWDTHTQQAQRLQRLLAALDQGLAALREGLGTQWQRSTVLVMTEFGRCAVLNGSGGTDHGTAGMALLAGGAVAGGRVIADWPGLAPTALLDGRDLRPTQDIRGLIGAVLQRQFGLSRAQLQAGVLPGAPAAEQLALWRS
jgi:uncharacterized protein (DUF1501 family)